MKNFFAFILVIVLAGFVIFGVSYGSYLMYEFFAPKYTAVNAKVFKESVQYNESMVRDLENLELEYQHTDANGKAALRPIIIHRFEVYDEKRLSPDLRNFYESIRNQGIN